uniref:Uncharacterized protein n=1 Tax=Ditylenchus dipsaci TaxID=166011 RepID=A0A915CZ90_9BILA
MQLNDQVKPDNQLVNSSEDHSSCNSLDDDNTDIADLPVQEKRLELPKPNASPENLPYLRFPKYNFAQFLHMEDLLKCYRLLLEFPVINKPLILDLSTFPALYQVNVLELRSFQTSLRIEDICTIFLCTDKTNSCLDFIWKMMLFKL